MNAEGVDRRRYNLPTTDSEIAVILPGDGEEHVEPRDIISYGRNGRIWRINDSNPAFMPMHFVLLFPRGEKGWWPGIHRQDAQTAAARGDARQ